MPGLISLLLSPERDYLFAFRAFHLPRIMYHLVLLAKVSQLNFRARLPFRITTLENRICCINELAQSIALH